MWRAPPSYAGLISPSTLIRRHCGALVATAQVCASRAASSGGMGIDAGESAIGVDAVARPIGYGPFSAAAKTRLACEKAHKAVETCDSAAAAASATVMNNVTLDTNLYLRLSLAGLPHPSQLQEWAYMSPEWRLAFVRLYRTILRLHNKAVAVSLRTARRQGSEAALSAATGVHATSQISVAGAAVAATEVDNSLAEDKDDYFLRYLLTPDQQEFGNRFVQGEFARHMDADAVAAAIFYASWYEYVLQLASGVTAREMTEKEKRLLTDEQKETLNSLRGAFFGLRASQQPKYMP
ncbi:Complex1_LYR-like family protein [Leishmania donovani]|uniref:Succinate dehydrogenase assembly factor 3 n=2 Tax=Leishmania donovani TaxID=5661 RepID=A0A504XJN9_LEIDO|nr:Complex1_LYR-like family protein [Leishmania donovani]